MNYFRAKLDYILKHNTFIQKTFLSVASFALKTIGLFVKTDENLIVFSAHGRKYNDSPKVIYEYIKKQQKYNKYKCVWALENPDDTEIEGCLKVKVDTLKYFLTTLKAKYWVTCVNIERGLKYKKKNTIYLNTWHGIPIKTIGNEASGRNDYDFSYINYFCISSEYEKKIYMKSFNIPEENLVRTGMPRNDVLYDVKKEKIIEIKKKLGIPNDKKVILYAPTWRDSKDGGKSYSIKPPIDIKLWEKVLGDNYIVLFRTHPYTNKLMGISFNEFVRDYTNYPNVNELMMVSDVLISDYSAIIFDYSILERPVICFAYDYELYKNERGIIMDLEAEIPGGISYNENHVLERIINMNYENESSSVVEFKNKYVKYGTNATKRCVELLFNCCDEN